MGSISNLRINTQGSLELRRGDSLTTSYTNYLLGDYDYFCYTTFEGHQGYLSIYNLVYNLDHSSWEVGLDYETWINP